jgi:hypothetical protein
MTLYNAQSISDPTIWHDGIVEERHKRLPSPVVNVIGVGSRQVYNTIKKKSNFIGYREQVEPDVDDNVLDI